jgi:hypothetical protein
MRGNLPVAVAAALAVTGAGLAAGALLDQPAPPPQVQQASRVPTAPAAPQPSQLTPSPSVIPPAPPATLVIPRIAVHSSVGTVGITASGAMEVPSGAAYDSPAWYRYSPMPGSPGPAVIVGHVDSTRGPAVFYRLASLRAGDLVDVGRADGRIARFTVYAVVQVAKNAFPTAQVYGNTAGPELRLITCGGPFDAGSGHYVDNVVAFARLDSITDG